MRLLCVFLLHRWTLSWKRLWYVSLTPITNAPAETPIILKGTPGPHNLTVVESADDIEKNELKYSRGGNFGGESTEYDIYALAKKNDVVGFYKVANNVTVPEGKCFIRVKKPTTNEAPEYLGFAFGDATAIDAVQKQVENGQFFNLNGQRVAQPTKGLYIVNGRKVIVK